MKKGLLAAGLAAAALLAMTNGVGHARQPPAQAPVLPADRTYTVTLLTGDIVTVHTRQSGCPTVSVRSTETSGGYHTSCGPDGHVRVIPGAAAALVGRVLDEDLFDVTTLIEEGYDDASSTDIPLIVRTGNTRTATISGFAQRRTLPSIGAVAGRQPKSGGARFVAAMTEPADRTSADGPLVWLDHRVRATQGTDNTRLDTNLHQVRAPQAWAAGHTGAGVRVAVLDSGIDPTHPALAGKVVEKADFTVEGGDAVDRAGHGTHVAAIVAGTGAGSAGARRGVAPDAQLVIGKVLHDNGRGYESEIIAGMEWAAPRAKVVNMSLGGGSTDGTDAAALAVEELTRRHGTLFVVAAGNNGPDDSTVSTPAVAPSALAVGAVDANDTLAEFSSRGPVVGTRALKPEIVAPGVDIVSARAAGTTMGVPIDAHYTRVSGTSMATPHVAGAAAVLAQVHPDWDASRLKAALVGAADPVNGDPYEVGAGRLDVVSAANPVASGTSVVNLGTFAYPQSGTAETKVEWTNAGSRPAGLTLEARLVDRHGKSTVDPAVTLSTATVTVPATGSASAVLTVDRERFAARPGLYTAVVTARWAGGTASTPVSFYVEPPSHDLTVTSTPPPGAAPDSEIWGWVDVVNLDDPALYYSLWVNHDLRVRVPAGRYSVMGNVNETAPPGAPDEYQLRSAALAGDPDVAVTADTTVILDGSAGKPVAASVDGMDTIHRQTTISFLQRARRGVPWAQAHLGLNEVAAKNRLYATPTDAVGIGSFQAYEGFVLDSTDGTTHYALIRPLPNRIPDDLTYHVTANEHTRLARIDQRFRTLDTPDPRRDHHRTAVTTDGVFVIEDRPAGALPPTRVDYLSPEGVWTESGGSVLGNRFTEPSTRYAPGSQQEKIWARQPLRPDWSGGGASTSPCRPEPVTRTKGLLRVRLVELTDQHNRFTCLGFPPVSGNPWLDKTTRTMTLSQNGQTIGTTTTSSADFPLPKQPATYHLTYDLDASAVLPVSTKVNTAWTFRSTAPKDTSSTPVPLLSVDYALPLDDTNHPTTGEAQFTVHQTPGTPTQKITTFTAWTSTDDGTTWTPADVRRVSQTRFAAHLPTTQKNQGVSLRVTTTADGGSTMEQTIIRAYR